MVTNNIYGGRALRIAVGITMLAILLLVNGAGAGNSYEFVLGIPSQQWFIEIPDIAVDSGGNVYVADTGNNRIQKFGNTPTQLSGFTVGQGTSDQSRNYTQRALYKNERW